MADLHNIESPDKAALRRRAASDAEVESATRHAHENDVHPLLRLQTQVGNAHIARLLAQRAAPEEEEEVQAKHETVGLEGGPVGPDTSAQIHTLRGGGAPLDESTRTSMEQSFGTSFSDVRVHSDANSDTLNRRLTARAFTTGSDIFLRRDSSPSDSRLIAHELTHVVQQRSMSSGGGGMQVAAAGDGHERHADAVAEAVTTTASTPVQARHELAQRAADDDEELQAQHEAMAQREADDEELQAKHDLAQRAAPEEEEIEALHDPTLHREADEEELQAQHDPAVQREDDEELQASHDVAQRETTEGDAAD